MSKKLYLALSVLLVAVFVLSACASTTEAPVETQAPVDEPEVAEETEAVAEETDAMMDPAEWDIVFVTPYGAVPYWQEIESGMNAANADLGTNCEYIGPSDLDLDAQLAAIDTSIASQVDGIITNGYVPETFAPYFERATEAGIPIVLVDADAPDTTRTTYIGTSNVQAGYEAGMAMAEFTGGEAVIGVLTGPLDSVNLNQRLEGFQQAVAEYPGMEIVTIEVTDVDLLKANEKSQAMLAAYPEMNAIFGISQVDIIGAAQVVEERGLEGMLLIGFDDAEQTIDYIRQGVVTATIVQRPYMMGYMGVESMLKILNGETVDEIYDTGVTVVTIDNVDSYKEN